MTSEDQGQYLVIDYLTGNMEPGDTENLKRWLSESEANRDYFRDMKDVWFSVVCDSEYEFDAERAYGEFLERIDNKKRKEKVARRGVRIRRVVRYTAAAMTTALLCTAGFMTGRNYVEPIPEADVTVRVPFGSTTDIMLPDSTLVQLNAGSCLVYSRNYGIENRNVLLDGEARITVRHNEALPFVLNAADMEIRDVGTVFNVRNYSNDDTAVVTLLEGEVKVSMNGDKIQNSLTRDQRLVYDRRDSSVKVDHTDATASAQWADGILFFDEERLGDIAKTLERCYGVSIDLKSESLAGRRIYGSFAVTELDVEEIIGNICTVAGIHYKTHGKKIILY